MLRFRRNLYSKFRVTARRCLRVSASWRHGGGAAWILALFVLIRDSVSVTPTGTTQQYGGVIVPTG